MAKPRLWIIAGCNGAGKSSYSNALVEGGVIPFDYDAYFLKYYRNLQPTEIQDQMAHNMAFGELERQVENAIAGSRDFAYETNFNSTPLFWPERFKDKGYEIRMIYLVLDSIDEAVRRVAVRVQNGGHFVSENEIRKRYFQGFENLDRHFGFFDLIDVFDCSEYEHEPKFCFSIFDGEINYLREFPEFLKRLVPNLYDSVSG